MPNTYFKFKQFTICQDRCAMKVCTDACVFGAWVAEQIANTNKGKIKLLDIGAGTGLLTLMVAQKNLIVADLVEINKDAAIQCEQNVNNSPWASSCKVYQKNIGEFNPGYQYDIIISNPPFYENDLRSDDADKNMAYHSLHFSLDALMGHLKKRLLPDGSFFLLFPEKRWAELETKMEKNGLCLNEVIHVHQTVNQPAFRVMIKGSFNQKERITSVLYIQNEKKEYTPGFIDLLKDYYLYL